MSTGLIRLVGTTIDTTETTYHKYLFCVVDAGSLISNITICAKYMFQQAALSTDNLVGLWSHSIGWVAHGASAPPFGWAAPSDDSILAYDLAEPDGLERVFWAPSSDTASIVPSFTKTIRFRGQLRVTEDIDLYYLKDANNQSSVPTSTTTFAWSVWFGA